MERTFCPWQTGNQTPFLLELGQSSLLGSLSRPSVLKNFTVFSPSPEKLGATCFLGQAVHRNVHLYTCYICVHVHICHMYMYEGQRMTLVSSSIAPVIIFEAGYVTEPEPTNSARLAGRWPPGIFLSLSLRCWAYRYTLAFYTGVGI